MKNLLPLLCVAAVMGGVGCTKYVPAPKPPPPPPPLKLQSVRQLGTPSPLIDPPPEPSVTDKMPFDLPLNRGYEIEGSWAGPSWDTGAQAFERVGRFTVRKTDQSDVDPAELDAALDKWVASTGVQRNQSERVGAYGRKSVYGTVRTLGTVQYGLTADAPDKSVGFTIRISEKPRTPR